MRFIRRKYFVAPSTFDSQISDIQSNAVADVTVISTGGGTLEEMLGDIMLNRIYQMDCLEGMKLIPDGSIDLTVTSPPYNLGIAYDSYDDNVPIEHYEALMQSVFTSVYRITKVGGRICVNIPPDIGMLKDGSKLSLDYLFYKLLENAGFKYRTKIVWNKNQITSRTAWGSFQSPSNPNILPPFEYVIVFHKETPKKEGDKSCADITRDEFVDWTNGLWNVAPESKKKMNHPAPYPEELCTRLMKMFSYTGDIVLDPFMGSGTTAYAAALSNRKFIGFELSSEYIEIANKRLEALV